jgi:hypothetical protein
MECGNWAPNDIMSQDPAKSSIPPGPEWRAGRNMIMVGRRQHPTPTLCQASMILFRQPMVRGGARSFLKRSKGGQASVGCLVYRGG